MPQLHLRMNQTEQGLDLGGSLVDKLLFQCMFLCDCELDFLFLCVVAVCERWFLQLFVL